MGIGVGIFLIAVGAILKFAVHARVSGIELGTVGVILMIVGVLGIGLEIALFAPRRRVIRTETTTTPNAVQRTVREDDTP